VKPIRLAEPFRAVFYAPFYVAEQRGFYAKHGVTVTRATAGDPTRAAEALLADQADVAWSGPMRMIMMRAADPTCPLRSFCAVVMRDPFMLLGRGPNPGFSLQDLPKLRFGSVKEVPTPWWCLQMSHKCSNPSQHGWKPRVAPCGIALLIGGRAPIPRSTPRLRISSALARSLKP